MRRATTTPKAIEPTPKRKRKSTIQANAVPVAAATPEPEAFAQDAKRLARAIAVINYEKEVNHPPHYQAPNDPEGVYEAIKIIEAHQLGFHLGNVVKYVLRAPYKGTELKDLQKAAWYLQRKIGGKPSYGCRLTAFTGDERDDLIAALAMYTSYHCTEEERRPAAENLLKEFAEAERR